MIDAASPPAAGNRTTGQAFYKTNVDGTACVIDCACRRLRQGFRLSSSVVVATNTVQHNATEDAPVKHRTSSGDDYSKTKAVAEDYALKHNGADGILTASLRLPSIHGERDEQNIARIVSGLRSGDHKVRIGDSTNLVDWCSCTNTARTDVLAALQLLREHDRPKGEGAAGEAFFHHRRRLAAFLGHFAHGLGRCWDKDCQQ